MSWISVDDARLSDLSVGGWIGMGTGVLGIAGILYTVGEWAAFGSDPAAGILIGGLATVLGFAFAHDNATPEEEGNCENCGAHVRTHASRDTADEVVLVQTSGKPRRAEVGPLSVVLQYQRPEYIYCSGECAAEDERILISGESVETSTSAEVSERVH